MRLHRKVRRMRYTSGGTWTCDECGRVWTALDVPHDEVCPHAGRPLSANTLTVELPPILPGGSA